MDNKKSILVTGAAGNIGTNLCNELRTRGHRVIASDLYNTEREDYIRADVRNHRQLQYVFDELGLLSYADDINDSVLLTHVIFHPVQKSKNREIEIVYTVRVQLN